VSAELAAIEASSNAIKTELKHLHASAAREVELEGGRKAVLLFVPFPLLAEFRKIQKTLVEELEKKLGGTHVLLLANRTMISPSGWSRSKNFTGVRPRSRTLRAVQEGLLDDIVYPTEITGKRIRVRVDGSRLLKVHLNPKDAVAVEGKLETFRGVFKRLTNKDVALEFAAH
jgi:small subunit ribosomal protein S7e